MGKHVEPTEAFDEEIKRNNDTKGNHGKGGDLRNSGNLGNAMPKPLSGSKKVKNQNHSGQNHGEGS